MKDFNKILKRISLIFITIIIFTGIILFLFLDKNKQVVFNQTTKLKSTPSPTLVHKRIPDLKILSNGNYHIFQSFNNCGPAALSMALRFYGISVSQEELGQALRPYQVIGGDNDDKSVTLEEVAKKSNDYDLIPYLRPMGTNEIIKEFIANDMPVIARTWTKPNEDIGHFRVIKGYDNSKGIFIQDDSLQGKNLEYAYSDFEEIWKKFNYEYLVLVPKEKNEIAQRIIGEDVNEKLAWEKAIENSKKNLSENPEDLDAAFNLSVAYYKIGNYKKSVEVFEKIENKISYRTLWYQIEPIISYYEIGNYEKVFQITDKVLNRENRAFSELYILRGKIYKKIENYDLAKKEFEKAAFYNSMLKEPKELLNSL